MYATRRLPRFHNIFISPKKQTSTKRANGEMPEYELVVHHFGEDGFVEDESTSGEELELSGPEGSLNPTSPLGDYLPIPCVVLRITDSEAICGLWFESNSFGPSTTRKRHHHGIGELFGIG